MIRRIVNILVALDQLIYVLITLGYGMPDETLSSAAYRSERDGRILGRVFRPLIDALFFFQPGHCKIAYDCERRRAQLPAEFRSKP
jgi:hypothetical protein